MSQGLIRQQDRLPKRSKKRSAPVRRQPVSPEVRERIIELSVSGKTQAEIAKETKRSAHTVRGILRSPDAKRRKEELRNEVAETVRLRLIAGSHRAVDSWARQLELADDAQRANHLPAKDWLTHAGVVDIPTPPKSHEPQILIQIGGGKPEDVEPILVEDITESDDLTS